MSAASAICPNKPISALAAHFGVRMVFELAYKLFGGIGDDPRVGHTCVSCLQLGGISLDQQPQSNVAV